MRKPGLEIRQGDAWTTANFPRRDFERVDEGDHSERRNLRPLGACRRACLTDELACQSWAFFPKQRIHECAGPLMAHVFRERPRSHPYCAGCFQHETSAWRHELWRSGRLPVVMPVRYPRRFRISAMRPDPTHDPSPSFGSRPDDRPRLRVLLLLCVLRACVLDRLFPRIREELDITVQGKVDGP